MFLPLLVSLVTFNGVWDLPVKDIKTQLLIGQHKSNIVAVLKINADCKKPTMLQMYGTVKKASCGTWLELHSPDQKLSKTCTLKTTILACGKMVKNRYKVRGAVVSGVFCKGKKPTVAVDDLTGVWIRKGVGATRKIPKRKPRPKAGTPISI